MDYKERLKAFNSTEKYQRELAFVFGMMLDGTEILDYGCGIGTAVNYIYKGMEIHGRSVIVKGCEINNYFDQRPSWLLEGEPIGTYDHITFIHSLAHIKNVKHILIKLKNNLVKGGRITVITPNKDWLDKVGDYKSDPTVIQHFRPHELKDLFIECGYKILQQGQFGEEYSSSNERLFIQVEKP